ncbi:MAG: hypothetical protein COA44_07190 [Arcobacter sp.]|nr:MAG: hypothetical protein COA44_07190 [Arcobacter sp.]
MNILSCKNVRGVILGVAASSVLLFSGCGSSSTDEVGVFQDSAVDGLSYKVANRSGVTSKGGQFNYRSGEDISFYIGDLFLGSASAKKNMTPLDIVAGANGQLTPEVTNVLRLLQTLDTDGDTSNGISLPASIRSLKPSDIDFSDEAAVIALLAQIDSGLTLISAEDALTHFKETLATIGESIDYIDYLGNTRTAAATAGAAEYHTGKGYGNTLFGSADNKCQNCHNELYDTWKSSMHGKSWTDPIFQSKMQDFLRTHINKIGENPTGSKEYTEAMIPKVAQTCIKCHAPGAFYAGDFKATLTTLKAGATTDDLLAAKINDQYNLASTTTIFDTTKETAVVAVSHTNGNLYKLTYQIGHKANQEGINCAFCHSIETPRLMKGGDSYTLKADMRSGAHGPIIRNAGDMLVQNDDATSQDMNNFFRLWGPEKPVDYASTNKDADDVTKRISDGRYTMHSIDLNGTNGKVHFTGGPFYGPFGVTGKTNENASDESNRTANINPHYDKDNNNHFGESGKGLCLSCHQRSAGAKTAPGMFMELCSTQMAVTTGSDTASNDSLSSPKCQKCHMERIEGTLLHRWADPQTLWTTAVNPGLTAHFDPADPDGLGDENPVVGEWYNSHAFLGASKTGHKTSVTAKIKSGFSASLSQSVVGDTLTVDTTFMNKTAHMFPGAHPMRRALTRVIVKDQDGATIAVTTSTGNSSFSDIANTVTPLSGKVLDASQPATVTVADGGSAALTFSGKVADLDGSAISSQKFDGTAVTIPGTDNTITNQTVTSGLTEGTVSNAAIVDSSDTANFTRIYGHETGKKYDLDNDALTPDVFVVRPGFDSNTVASDTRLSPNETETYTLTYDITNATSVTIEYRVYYMQKGANGKFIVDPATGFLDQAASDAKKLLVTQVESLSEVISH